MLNERDIQMYWDTLAKAEHISQNADDQIEAAQTVLRMLDDLLCNVSNVNGIDLYDRSMKDIERTMRYAVEDVELVADMFDTLLVYWDASEASSVNGVTNMSLYLNGQQVRCFSLLYDEAASIKPEDPTDIFVIDDRVKEKIHYSGGFVNDPIVGFHKNIICLDFASLYPSIMQEKNVCYTTFVPPEEADMIPDHLCHIQDVYEPANAIKPKKKKKDILELIEAPLEPEPEQEMVHYRYKFVKSPEGLLPKIVRDLVARRRAVRADQAKVNKKEDPLKHFVLESKQLNLKWTANSMYGFLGVQDGGKLPFVEGAQAITARGRELINMVNEYLKKTYPHAKIVYNDTDSVFVDLGIEDPKECNAVGKKLSAEVSALFPSPHKMEFEKAMDVLLIEKKHYVAVLINDKGEYKFELKDILLRGVTATRRDNCEWVRQSWIKIMYNRFKRKTIADTLDLLIEMVLPIQNRTIDWKDLLLIREMGEYTDGSNYYLATFAREQENRGKPIQSGNRFEFLICDLPGGTGKRMRLLEDYLELLETPDALVVDYSYYLEKLFMTPIETLYKVGYMEDLRRMTGLGYKPKSRHHFVPISCPVRIMVRMIHDGVDIRMIRELLNPSLPREPKIHNIRIHKQSGGIEVKKIETPTAGAIVPIKPPPKIIIHKTVVIK
jgi:DNA polymerase delta subunit 1